MTSLNQNEWEALRILWEGTPLKPGEIQERFSWPVDNGTLRSALVNLVAKGHATRTAQGKAFVYAATVPKQTLLRSMLQSVARVFAGGSPKDLVAQMVETGDVTARDLKLISEIAAGKGRSAGRRKS